jgi:probable HAF family extracellular repeat protein
MDRDHSCIAVTLGSAGFGWRHNFYGSRYSASCRAATSTFGYAINSSGQVTGISTYGDGTRFHAFLYTPGLGMTDLGSLPGADSSDGYGINTSGQVMGDSYNSTFPPTNEQVVLYTKGSGMTAAVSTSQQGAGNPINDKGQIAGTSYVPATLGGQAFVYSPGSGTVDQGTFSGANAIYASGQVAG